MKLSVNETKLTGLCARNCATIQQVLILKFGPEKLPGLSRNGPLAGYILEGLVSFDEGVWTLGKIVEDGRGSLQWGKMASQLADSLVHDLLCLVQVTSPGVTGRLSIFDFKFWGKLIREIFQVKWTFLFIFFSFTFRDIKTICVKGRSTENKTGFRCRD